MIAPHTLTSLLASYLAHHDLAPTSRQQLEITVALFERWHTAEFNRPPTPADLAAETIGQFVAEQLRDGRAPKTCNRKRGDLITLARFAARSQAAAPIDPADVFRARETRRIPDAWTIGELSRLFAAARSAPQIPGGWDGRHDLALVRLMWDTALRFSACLELQTDDLRDGLILARGETQKTRCDELFQLSPETLAALAATNPASPGKLFPWPRAKRAYWTRWKKIMAAAGLPVGRREGPQKLRRTSASHLEAAAPGSAAAHLGHRTPGLALRHYIDPRIARPPAAAAILPKISPDTPPADQKN